MAIRDGFIDAYFEDPNEMGLNDFTGSEGLMSVADRGQDVANAVMAPSPASVPRAEADNPMGQAAEVNTQQTISSLMDDPAPTMPKKAGPFTFQQKQFKQSMNRYKAEKTEWDKRERGRKLKSYAEQTDDPQMKAALLSGLPKVEEAAIKQMFSTSDNDPKTFTVGADKGMIHRARFGPNKEVVLLGQPFRQHAPTQKNVFDSRMDALQDPNRRGDALTAMRNQWQQTDTGAVNVATGQKIDKNIVEGKVQEGLGQSISQKLEGFNDYGKQSQTMEYEADRIMSDLDALSEGANKWSTGWGSMLSSVPATEAKAWQERRDAVVASVAMDKMMQLKAASPSGATGFGALSDGERKLLEKHLASLEQANSAPEIKKSITRIQNHMKRVKKNIIEDRKKSTSWYERNKGRREQRQGPQPDLRPPQQAARQAPRQAPQQAPRQAPRASLEERAAARFDPASGPQKGWKWSD